MAICRLLTPGFESKVPVLFLDLNEDLLTPCDDDPEGACVTGKLPGEKPETMIDLPIITREEHGVRRISLPCVNFTPLSLLSLLLEPQLHGTRLFIIQPV